MSKVLDTPIVPVPVDQEWTPELLLALPETHKYEVREGNLVIMSAAHLPFHGRTQYRITHLLGELAYPEAGLNLGPKELRTCDVGVFHEQPTNEQAYWPPQAYSLVVEIVSPSSEREDREIKPRLYAAAGIPVYWLVERSEDGEPLVHQFTLEDGAYRPSDGPIPLSNLEQR